MIELSVPQTPVCLAHFVPMNIDGPYNIVRGVLKFGCNTNTSFNTYSDLSGTCISFVMCR